MADKKFEQYTEETSTTSDDLVLIKEKTAGATKRVQLGNLLPTGSVTTTKLADSAITPNKLVAGSGTTWASQSWTPTWAGLAVGNGVLSYALFHQAGKFCRFRLKFTLGTTSTVTGTITFSLPLTAASNQDIDFGGGYIDDAGVAGYPCIANIASTTTAGIIVSAANGTYTTRASVNATTPFSLGNGDAIRVWGTYEVA